MKKITALLLCLVIAASAFALNNTGGQWIPPESRPYLITKLGRLQHKRAPERKVFPREEDRKNLIETPRHGIISTVGKEKTGPENRLPLNGLAARRGGEKERSEG